MESKFVSVTEVSEILLGVMRNYKVAGEEGHIFSELFIKFFLDKKQQSNIFNNEWQDCEDLSDQLVEMKFKLADYVIEKEVYSALGISIALIKESLIQYSHENSVITPEEIQKIRTEAIEFGVQDRLLVQKEMFHIAATYTTNLELELQGKRLPFISGRIVETLPKKIFDSPRYTLINKDNQPIHVQLHEVEVHGSGHCGFTVMGTDRFELTNTVLDPQTLNPHVRGAIARLLAERILMYVNMDEDVLRSDYLSQEGIRLLVSSDKRAMAWSVINAISVMDKADKFAMLEASCDSDELIEIFKRIELAAEIYYEIFRLCFDSHLSLSDRHLYEELIDKNVREWVDTINDSKDEVSIIIAKQKLTSYCHDFIIFKKYLDHYKLEQSSWLSHGSMKLYAVLENKRLEFYQIINHNNVMCLKLDDQRSYLCDNSNNIIRTLYKNGNHFNLLDVWEASKDEEPAIKCYGIEDYHDAQLSRVYQNMEVKIPDFEEGDIIATYIERIDECNSQYQEELEDIGIKQNKLAVRVSDLEEKLIDQATKSTALSRSDFKYLVDHYADTLCTLFKVRNISTDLTLALLQVPITVNSFINDNNDTFLHVALRERLGQEVVALLISLRAGMFIANKQNIMPIDLVTDFNAQDDILFALLRQAQKTCQVSGKIPNEYARIKMICEELVRMYHAELGGYIDMKQNPVQNKRVTDSIAGFFRDLLNRDVFDYRKAELVKTFKVLHQALSVHDYKKVILHFRDLVSYGQRKTGCGILWQNGLYKRIQKVNKKTESVVFDEEYYAERLSIVLNEKTDEVVHNTTMALRTEFRNELAKIKKENKRLRAENGELISRIKEQSRQHEGMVRQLNNVIDKLQSDKEEMNLTISSLASKVEKSSVMISNMSLIIDALIKKLEEKSGSEHKPSGI